MHRNNKPMAGGVKAIPYGAHKSIFNCLELTFQNKYQKKKNVWKSHALASILDWSKEYREEINSGVTVSLPCQEGRVKVCVFWFSLKSMKNNEEDGNQ